jgi:hypothetical protein
VPRDIIDLLTIHENILRSGLCVRGGRQVSGCYA